MKIESKHPCHAAALAVASWWHEAVTGGKITSIGEGAGTGDAMMLGILAGTTGRPAAKDKSDGFAQDLYDLALDKCAGEYGLYLSTDYGPEGDLYRLAAKHRLGGCFPNKTRMSAQIDIVTVAAGYHAPRVVLYDALTDKVQEVYGQHDTCPTCALPWKSKHFEGFPPAVREIGCFAAPPCSESIRLVARQEARTTMRNAMKEQPGSIRFKSPGKRT